MVTDTIESRIRRFLLALAGFIFLGTLIELLLEEHTKETLQFVPFILCIAGFISIAAAFLRPEKQIFLILRITMLVTAVGGLFGMGIHLYTNFTFEQDIHPNAAVGDLILSTLKGAAPLLAPGILVFAALIALIATYYHPILGKREALPN